MQNIKSIINKHNMKLLSKTAEIRESCNCRKKTNYRLCEKCLTPNIIYEARITSNQPNYKEKAYIGTQKQISNTDLANIQNISTSNNMKTTWSYPKNMG